MPCSKTVYASPTMAAGAVALWWGLVVVALAGAALRGAQAQLSPEYYASSCPADVVSGIVSGVVGNAFSNDRGIAAGLLRIHFHDCFVGGCDASLLLDGTGSEKDAAPNRDSLQEQAFAVVDQIKEQLENACPGVVSCADILALAAMVTVHLAGGPSWAVMLGRKDSFQPNLTGTDYLPKPTEGLKDLKNKFADVGLDDTDFVALHGAHTIGRARCSSIAGRLSNSSDEPPIQPAYLAELRMNQCPWGSNDDMRLFLDNNTPDVFDNRYYANLITDQGLLQSDQELYTPRAPDADPVLIGTVTAFAASTDAFFQSFVTAMVKMGNMSPLTGGMGEIRQRCRAKNGS